jgi:hypothetical protein
MPDVRISAPMRAKHKRLTSNVFLLADDICEEIYNRVETGLHRDCLEKVIVVRDLQDAVRGRIEALGAPDLTEAQADSRMQDTGRAFSALAKVIAALQLEVR